LSADRLRIFAVVSWGCAATHWLAQALDSHPELRCFQNLNGKIARVGGGKLNGVDYARLLATQGLGHTAVGDVHGFARDTIPEIRRSFGDRFECAVLVRDPLPRYRSQLAHFRNSNWQKKGSRPWEVDYLKLRARRAGLRIGKDDYASWLFVHGANMLNMILEERKVGPVVRMEDLVSSPDALCSLVSMLTGGGVEPSLDWAAQAVSQPRVLPHAKGGDTLSEGELDVLDRIVRPEAWQAYRELGYAC
jgi:hypothetical protein